MKPYENRKPTEYPDMVDLKADGRYGKAKGKKTTRRYLKRSDKARSRRRWMAEIDKE